MIFVSYQLYYYQKMDNQEKGLLYEKFVKDFIIKNLKKDAYLWNECPEEILIKNNLISSNNHSRLIRKDIKEGNLHFHKDIGIDVIQIENENTCSIVQCKNGYTNGLTIENLSGIIMRAALIRDITSFIYYTNKISSNIKYLNRLSKYTEELELDDKTNLDKLKELSLNNKINFIKFPIDTSKKETIEIDNKIIPYYYQQDAYDKSIDYFKNKNRGILSLPCGCGKTYTSYLISNNYEQVILISPLIEFAHQNLNKFIEYGYNPLNTLLVNSDGYRDIDYIKSFIKNNTKFLISSTYHSIDIISQCLDCFNNPLFIVDEFHNITKENLINKDNCFNKLLKSNHKILFMSATPRIYNIEPNDEQDETDEDYDVNYLIGDSMYNMSFNEAIKNNLITDYKIYIPSIHETNYELDEELSIYKIQEQYKNKCKFLFSAILNSGLRKCIVYCSNIINMKTMIKTFNTLNEFYLLDYDIYEISSNDDNISRKKSIEAFTNTNDKIQLLFNIRILNECIDIPACDSIYITEPPKNKITTIQRINRATRIDKNNPFKIAKIYIWCDEYKEIMATLSSIKEYDENFNTKINIASINFYNRTDDEFKEQLNEDIKTITNYVVNVKEYKYYKDNEKLDLIEEYLNEYNKLPSKTDINSENENQIIRLIKFINYFKKYYKEDSYKDLIIYERWIELKEKYSHLFIEVIEKWKVNLKKLIEYIETTKKLPSKKTKEDLALNQWTHSNKRNYENKTGNVYTNETLRELWKDFMSKYKDLFKDNDEKWISKYDATIEYIKKYDKLPSKRNENLEIKTLGIWIGHQHVNYERNLGILNTNEEYKSLWKELLDTYPQFFRTNEEEWYLSYDKLKEYVDKYKKLPTVTDKENKVIFNWYETQKKNYKKEKEIMANETIRKEWEEFVEKNKKLFRHFNDIWMNRYNEAIDYINENGRLPTESKNKTLAGWITTQKSNINKNIGSVSTNKEFNKLWLEFTDKYL